MLAITTEAAEAITGLLTREGVPEGAGVRLASQTMPGEAPKIEVALTEGPMQKDQVIEEGPARVFVDETLTPVVDDKVLHASVEEDRVQFVLTEQASPQS